MIRFNQDAHRYYLGEQELMSVTKFIERFETPFDKEFWSYYTACKRTLPELMFKPISYIRNQSKLEDTILTLFGFETSRSIRAKQQDIILEWDAKRIRSAEKGSAYHSLKEQEGYKDSILTINEHEENVIGAYYFKLSEAPDGAYQEKLLYNRKLGIAGTVDKLIIKTIDGIRTAFIDDYKTNEKIDTENKFTYFKEPISHLQQCKLNKYMLQVSLYAYLIELHGFKIGGVQFTHHPVGEDLKLIGDPKIYKVRYAKEEVIAMLEYNKKF